MIVIIQALSLATMYGLYYGNNKTGWIYSKSLRSNQLLGVDQRLGVTPKRKKNNHFCLHSYESLTWASRTHDEKSMFLIILEHFLSFSTMQKHEFAGWNTQHQ